MRKKNATPNFMVPYTHISSLNRSRQKKKMKESESNVLLLLVQGLIGFIFFFDLAANHGAGHGASLVHTAHHG